MPTKIKKNTLITKIILMKRFFKTFIFLNLKTMLRDIYIYIYLFIWATNSKIDLCILVATYWYRFYHHSLLSIFNLPSKEISGLKQQQ
jgi:hypothetical protein